MGVRCAADPGTDCDAPPLLGAQNSVVRPAELVVVPHLGRANWLAAPGWCPLPLGRSASLDLPFKEEVMGSNPIRATD